MIFYNFYYKKIETKYYYVDRIDLYHKMKL